MKTKKLKLADYGVREMTADELREVEGGRFRIAVFNFALISIDWGRTPRVRLFHTGW